MRESNHAFILSIFVKMLRKSIYSLLLNAKDVILSIYHIFEIFLMIPMACAQFGAGGHFSVFMVRQTSLPAELCILCSATDLVHFPQIFDFIPNEILFSLWRPTIEIVFARLEELTDATF